MAMLRQQDSVDGSRQLGAGMQASVADPSPEPQPAARQLSVAAIMRSMVPSLVINGAFPFILYQVLTGNGVATVPALVAGAVFPLTYTLWGWVRTRHLDLIAGISLFFIVTGATASLVSGSTRFTLIKESFFTGLFGLVFFGSLLAPRPFMFYMAREFATGGAPERMGLWDQRWQYPSFRHAMRVMTAMWGVTFVADALIRVGLVFVLSTSVFLVTSQVLFYGMFATTLFITVAYGRRAQRRGMALQEAMRVRESDAATSSRAGLDQIPGATDETR
jgi:intracellular septation protein A